MAYTDTKINNLVLNVLSKEQYESITPNENELYLTEDDTIYIENKKPNDSTFRQILIHSDGTLTASNNNDQIMIGIGNCAIHSAGCIAIGGNTYASGNRALAIGYQAKANGAGSIQIGTGSNTTENTLMVGLNSNNYTLLDANGVIPSERLTNALPATTKYGSTLILTIDSSTYVLTATLKDQDGNVLGTSQTVDLPLESVVVNGSYDSSTKEVILTLQNGNTVKFSVADLVSGLQTEITSTNLLNADLVDDSTSTHKFVTEVEKTAWNNKQSALNTEQLKAVNSGITAELVEKFSTVDNKQDILTAGNGIKIENNIISGLSIDNSTIIKDSNDVMKVVGITDSNTNSSKNIWVGTEAEYNESKNLGLITEDDLCYITDDSEDDYREPLNINNYISNCIKELPQTSAFRVEDGKLIILSGSSLYEPIGKIEVEDEEDMVTITIDPIPNTSVVTLTAIGRMDNAYNKFTLNSDIVSDVITLSSGNYMVSYNKSTNSLIYLDVETQQFSGSTQPSVSSQAIWYNEDENIIKYTDNGTIWTQNCVLPICIVHIENEVGITNVEQTFNGYGFIGSTLFVYDNLVGLIPNGRNSDGTAKNAEFKTTRVYSETFTDSSEKNILVSNKGIIGSTAYVFNNALNYNFNGGNMVEYCHIGRLTTEDGLIKTIDFKSVFSALDYNEIHQLKESLNSAINNITTTINDIEASLHAINSGV